jgi:hypothetical protein
MARFYECIECEHAQLVGIIDNGLPAGFADPDARCEKCGAVGTFHFGPGAARQLRESMANAVRVDPPDPSAFDFLKHYDQETESK